MNRRLTLLPILLLIAAFGLAACGGDDDSDGADAPAETTGTDGSESAAGEEAGTCEEVAAPEAKEVDVKKPKANKPGADGVVVKTSCGEFTISFDERAPKTAASFEYLAEQGVLDNTPFHRIANGFVIQGGDPSGNGTGGPGYSVDEKPPGNLSYTRGTVAMAKTGAEPPGRSGSQFFVVTAPDAGLPPDFALVGEVTEGFEVVEQIEALGVPGSDGPPSQPVVIESVEPTN